VSATVIRAATVGDIQSWLEIVREIEPFAGPMPDFADHIRRGMERGTALVTSDGPSVIGACLLSPDQELLAPEDTPQEIRWIAVRESARRRGAGSALLGAIERRWQTGDISVVTFTESVVEGRPARRFYESHGFELRGGAPPASDGGARDLYVLPAQGRVRR
jgi:GNAT superfamily N-acetyltransferase